MDLSAVIDDGEAITGAIALHRGYAVAIDDRKARRVLGKRVPAKYSWFPPWRSCSNGVQPSQ